MNHQPFVFESEKLDCVCLLPIPLYACLCYITLVLRECC